MWFLLWLGCSFSVHMTTAPEMAVIRLADGTELSAPTVHTFKCAPFTPQRVEISAPGYRSATYNLRSGVVGFWHYLHRPRWVDGDESARNTVRFILVPEHGPAGTWSEDEATRQRR